MKSLGIGASILVLFFIAVIQADVKLRVYLKDGTLQAGNLVKESPETFVLVTPEGRVEVSKDKIMFVNGKTLRQWEEQGKKDYQTEILPSDVPDPAFVNSRGRKRTPIDPYSSIQSGISEGEQVKRKSEPPKMALPPAPPLEKKVEVPEKVVEKTEPAPPPVVKKKIKNKPKVVQNIKPEKEKKHKPTQASKGFNRVQLAGVHYQNALGYIKENQPGQAIQELHYAQILDRKSTDVSLKLGELYMEAGVFGRARKYFEHPNLKKTEQVVAYVDQIAKKEKLVQFTPYIWGGIAFAGFLIGTIPLISIKRKIVHTRKTKIIDADTMSAEDISADPVAEVEPELAPQRTESPPVMPPPIVVPVIIKPQPVAEQVKPVPPPMEVIRPNPIAKPEIPEPVISEPVLEIPHPLVKNHQQIIDRANLVSLSIDRGNQFCAEGQLDQARREYRTAMAIDPNAEYAYVGLGYLAYIQGQWELAMEFYVRGLRINENSADAHYGIGRILIETDHVDDGVQELERALELDPRFDDARDTLTYLGKAA